MSVSDSRLAAVRELFAATPELRIKRMFGGAGVFSGELMFALVFEEEVYLRADEATRALFEAAGCERFAYRRKGEAASLGYWRAPDEAWDDPEAARRWVSISVEAAARTRAGKRKAGARRPPELLISGPWDEG